VWLRGTDLLTRPEGELHAVRGKTIGMVFQDPMSALNPLMSVGAQVMEPLRAAGVGRRAARARAAALLDDLGVAMRRPGCAPTRTSSPEACGNGSFSRWR